MASMKSSIRKYRLESARLPLSCGIFAGVRPCALNFWLYEINVATWHFLRPSIARAAGIIIVFLKRRVIIL